MADRIRAKPLNMQAAHAERPPLIVNFRHQFNETGGRLDRNRDDRIISPIVDDVEKGDVRYPPGHNNMYACGLLISMVPLAIGERFLHASRAIAPPRSQHRRNPYPGTTTFRNTP